MPWGVRQKELFPEGRQNAGEIMSGENLLQRVLTPHKINRLVLKPSYRKGQFDSHAVDCPFPFQCAVAPARGRKLGEIERNEVRGISLACG